MRGHLEARGERSWRAKVFLGAGPEGRQRYLSRTVHGTKREAQAVLNELLVEAARGEHAVTDATVADLVNRWFDQAKASLSPSTVRGYSGVIRSFILPRWGATKLRKLTTADLDAWYAELHRAGGSGGRPLSARSVVSIHAVLRRALAQGVRWGWLAVNPAVNASPPRQRKFEVLPPAPDDVVRLIKAAEEADPELGCFLRMSAVTGARRGEVCALRWTDIDLTKGRLTISRSIVGEGNYQLVEKDTKTHSSRRIAIDPATIERLKAHKASMQDRAVVLGTGIGPGSFVFSDAPDCSAPWRPNRVTLAFIRLRKEVGISGVRLHDLRHFAATRLLGAGIPVRTVSGRLGHANAATTLGVYAHFLEPSDEEAAGVMADLLADDLESRVSNA